jgi:hypothetical protein
MDVKSAFVNKPIKE